MRWDTPGNILRSTTPPSPETSIVLTSSPWPAPSPATPPRNASTGVHLCGGSGSLRCGAGTRQRPSYARVEGAGATRASTAATLSNASTWRMASSTWRERGSLAVGLCTPKSTAAPILKFKKKRGKGFTCSSKAYTNEIKKPLETRARIVPES